MAIVRAAGVALRQVLTAREERADNVARTSGDYRSPRRSLHLDAAYVSWRTGQNARRLSTSTPARRHSGSVSPDRGTGAGAGLRPRLPIHGGRSRLPGPDRIHDPAFLDELRHFRFTGEILAMSEGTVAFADEPLLRVTAPFREALLLESGLMRAIGVSTLIATKAARLVDAAAGREGRRLRVRRAHDPYLAARAAFIGGCASTSFVAGAVFDLPTGGTIPHALVQVFATEEEAFRAVAENLDRYSLLLDTYDVYTAIETAVAVAWTPERVWVTRWSRSASTAATFSPTASTCGGSWTRPACTRPRCSSAATSTSSASPTCCGPARRSPASASAAISRSGSVRSPAERSVACWGRCTSWSGTRAWRSGADQTGRGEEHVAGPQAGLPHRRVRGGRHPTR